MPVKLNSVGGGSITLDVPNLATTSTLLLPNTSSNSVILSTNYTGNVSLNGSILPGGSNTYDLGSTTFRWRNIYTGDLHLSNEFGNWTIVEGEDDLFLYNNKKNKVYKFNLTEVDVSEAPPKKAE